MAKHPRDDPEADSMAKHPRVRSECYSHVLRNKPLGLLHSLMQGSRLTPEELGMVKIGVEFAPNYQIHSDICKAVAKFDAEMHDNPLRVQMGIFTSSTLPAIIKVQQLQVEELQAINKLDQLAIFSAIYQGSGYVGGQVVRLRMLTGPEGAHHGLRPIRGRIVEYGVDMEVVRFLLRLREELRVDADTAFSAFLGSYK